MAKGLCPPPAPPFLLAAGAYPRKWPCSQPIFHAENASLRFAALLLLLRSRAGCARCKKPARHRRRSSCSVLVSTLSAPFASFVAVPVAADAPAGAPAHCLHWWCCGGLCYAQLLYLLLLQLKLSFHFSLTRSNRILHPPAVLPLPLSLAFSAIAAGSGVSHPLQMVTRFHAALRRFRSEDGEREREREIGWGKMMS